MRIRDSETEKERAYRQNILQNHTKKSFPIMGIVLIFMVLAFVFMWLSSSSIEKNQYGLGDPYHCSECKELGFACKEHRGYDVSIELGKEIDNYCIYYNPNTVSSEGKYFLYGNSHEYNINCDFCIIENTECYGCSYERQRLEVLAQEITTDEVFITKLCDSCWKLKYANCSNCRAMLAQEIKNSIQN